MAESPAAQGSPITVVTGASTGIGKAVADLSAGHGHVTYAMVRDPEGARDQHQPGEGSDLRFRRLDVCDPDSVAEAFGSILEEHGRIDNFVNNAGIYFGAPLEDTSLEKFEEMLDTNFMGAIRCLKQVVPGMRKRGSGNIVAVTSQSARIIFPTWTAYSASKAALEAALESLAMELSQFGVRVAMVEPGHVRTAMKDKIAPRRVDPAYAPMYERYDTIVASNRSYYIDPEPVAEVVWSALTDPEVPLRIPVGVDSTRHLKHRPLVSDESWAAVFAIDDDDDFYATWAKYVGSEDPRERAGLAERDPVGDR